MAVKITAEQGTAHQYSLRMGGGRVAGAARQIVGRSAKAVHQRNLPASEVHVDHLIIFSLFCWYGIM